MELNSLKIEKLTKINSEVFNKIKIFSSYEHPWDLSECEKFISNNDNALFIAYRKGDPVGFLTAYKLQRLDTKKSEVLLYEIEVLKEHRKLGIGKALINKVKEWGSDEKSSEVWVLTNKSNKPAMALYKSTDGFEDDPDITMFTYKELK